MRVRARFGRLKGVRALAFAICACLMVAPSAGALNHALVHVGASAAIHDEASHPNAAPHMDREEHLALDDCLVCLGSGQAVQPTAGWAELGTLEAPAAPSSGSRHQLGRVDLSGPPRAPPV